MIPDPTQMAQGGELVTQSFDAFPVLIVVFGVILLTTLGPLAISRLMKIIPRR